MKPFSLLVWVSPLRLHFRGIYIVYTCISYVRLFKLSRNCLLVIMTLFFVLLPIINIFMFVVKWEKRKNLTPAGQAFFVMSMTWRQCQRSGNRYSYLVDTSRFSRHVVDSQGLAEMYEVESTFKMTQNVLPFSFYMLQNEWFFESHLVRMSYPSGQDYAYVVKPEYIFYCRYVNDGRPFWQYIVSSSTGCSDAQYFEELYHYYTTEEVRFYMLGQ